MITWLLRVELVVTISSQHSLNAEIKPSKVVCGCFFRNDCEFRASKETHKGNKHEKEYIWLWQMAELQIGNDEVEKMNTVQILGNLARDPEVRYTQSGH